MLHFVRFKMFCFQEKIMNDPCNMVDVNKPHLELLFGLSNITVYISLVGYDGDLVMSYVCE